MKPEILKIYAFFITLIFFIAIIFIGYNEIEERYDGKIINASYNAYNKGLIEGQVNIIKDQSVNSVFYFFDKNNTINKAGLGEICVSLFDRGIKNDDS